MPEQTECEFNSIEFEIFKLIIVCKMFTASQIEINLMV